LPIQVQTVKKSATGREYLVRRNLRHLSQTSDQVVKEATVLIVGGNVLDRVADNIRVVVPASLTVAVVMTEEDRTVTLHRPNNSRRSTLRQFRKRFARHRQNLQGIPVRKIINPNIAVTSVRKWLKSGPLKNQDPTT
jgi:hypothetical protein